MTEEQQIREFFTQNDIQLLKLIGYSDEKKYNYLMKKVYEEVSTHQNCKLYDIGIPIPSDMNVIALVQQNVNNMNLNELDKEEIILSSNEHINYLIKEAIQKVLQPILIHQTFKTQTIKNNFLVKHIVWIYERIQEFDWNINIKPILVAYGELDLDEVYHLQVLNLLGVKILYINSSRDVELNKYSKIYESVITLNHVAPIELFDVRVANAVDVLNEPKQSQSKQKEMVTTWAKQAKTELHEELYSSNGVFRPWQFKEGTTKALPIDAVVEDIETYWEQEAKFRPGFKVVNNSVYVPKFITKINGTYTDVSKYKKLVGFTKNSKLTLFKVGVNLTNKTYSNEDMYSLAFIMNDDEVSYEGVKTHGLYRLNKLNIDVQNFIIRKTNDFIKEHKDKVEMKDLLELMATIITMEDEYAKLIECFDFPFKVPKLIVYISDRSNFDKRNGLFLNYLNSIGLDILIYSPTGSVSIEEHMYGEPLSVITLDEMNFDIEYEKLNAIKIKEKVNLLKKIFKL